MKNNFPNQKKLFKSKGTKWQQAHLDWAEEIMLTEDSALRTSMHIKARNFNSYLGKIRQSDYIKQLNPNGLKNFFIPEEIQHYPIAVPYLDVLIGEEFDRRFDWKAIVTNPNSISRIEEDKNNLLKEKIAELMNSGLTDEEAEDKLKNFIGYLNFEYQDVREKRANMLLRHFIKELDLKLKFNQGFKNVLIASEEAYIADVINNRPVIQVLDPKKTFVIKSGNSNKFEDADVIIIYDYISPGQVIDKYYKYLSSKEVSMLDNDLDIKHGGIKGSDLERDEHGINIFRNEVIEDILTFSEISGQTDFDNIKNSELVDRHGNIREIRMFWKSKKMIKRVKFYDEETGEPKYDYFSENYIPNTDKGEEVEEYWVSQWWEGVKVADKIYPFIRPREIQYNKFEDPGYNHPGIVGQIYNTGGQRPVSMIDRAMPFQLLYDATMYRVVDGLSKWFGSMPVVDYANIPEGWDVNKWLYFAKKAGIAVKDSFKEGKKGASLGKMAGGMSGEQNVMNQSGLGDYIQQQINILTYVEQQMGRIVGVPPQRLGEIENRETVGGVERAVTQSSFITNERYKIHDNVKKRVLTLLIETCKVAFKDNPTKLQFISDNHMNQIFDVDDEFLEEEYGILIDNDNDLSKLEQQLEGLTQAAIQNQMIKFSDVMKIFNSSSLSEKQRLIEKSEQDMQKRQEAAEKMKNDQVQAQLQQNAELAQRAEMREDVARQEELAMQKYKIDKDNATKLIIAEQNSKGVNTEDNTEDLELEYQKYEDELLLKMKELDEKIRNNKAKEKLEAKKITKMGSKPASK